MKDKNNKDKISGQSENYGKRVEEVEHVDLTFVDKIRKPPKYVNVTKDDSMFYDNTLSLERAIEAKVQL